MKSSRLQGGDDRIGGMSPWDQDDGSFVGSLKVGYVSVAWIEGDLEMRVDDTAWRDETGCRWEGERVGRASVGRAERGQWQAGDLFALATGW